MSPPNTDPAGLLVDTDVMVDFLHGRPEAVVFVNANATLIILSPIVITELYAGVRGNQELHILDELVRGFRVAPVTADIARAGGLYKRDYGKSHGVSMSDAILAATAKSLGVELKTLNIKHYPMLGGIRLAYRKP